MPQPRYPSSCLLSSLSQARNMTATNTISIVHFSTMMPFLLGQICMPASSRNIWLYMSPPEHSGALPGNTEDARHARRAPVRLLPDRSRLTSCAALPIEAGSEPVRLLLYSVITCSGESGATSGSGPLRFRLPAPRAGAAQRVQAAEAHGPLGLKLPAY